MTISQLSRRERRTISVAGAVLGLAIVCRLTVVPYAASALDTFEQLRSTRDAARREAALVASAGDLARDLSAAYHKLLGRSQLFLTGSTAREAATELATLIENVAAHAPIHIKQLDQDFGPAPELPGLENVMSHMEGESDLEGLLTLIAAIERSPLLLRVDEMSIETTVRGATSAGAAAVADPNAETVRFQFTVTGLRVANSVMAQAADSEHGGPFADARPGHEPRRPAAGNAFGASGSVQ